MPLIIYDEYKPKLYNYTRGLFSTIKIDPNLNDVHIQQIKYEQEQLKREQELLKLERLCSELNLNDNFSRKGVKRTKNIKYPSQKIKYD